MRNLCVVLAAVGASVLLSSPLYGTPIFSYSVNQSDYHIAVGQAVAVPVYLQEHATPPDASLLAAEGGLWIADVLVQRTSLSLLSPARLTGVFANEHDFDDLPAMLKHKRTRFHRFIGPGIGLVVCAPFGHAQHGLVITHALTTR